MLHEIAPRLAKIIRNPACFETPTEHFPSLDENRANIIVVRTRSCVPMSRPLQTIARTVEQILYNYPELGQWVVETKNKHGLAYIEHCFTRCAAP